MLTLLQKCCECCPSTKQCISQCAVPVTTHAVLRGLANIGPETRSTVMLGSGIRESDQRTRYSCANKLLSCCEPLGTRRHWWVLSLHGVGGTAIAVPCIYRCPSSCQHWQLAKTASQYLLQMNVVVSLHTHVRTYANTPACINRQIQTRFVPTRVCTDHKQRTQQRRRDEHGSTHAHTTPCA
jgi:hypothetical protein